MRIEMSRPPMLAGLTLFSPLLKRAHHRV